MTLDIAIDKYYNSIHAYIYGKTGKNKDFADECSNSVFFLFSLKGLELDDCAVFPWLMKTASNKSKEYFRKQGKENSVTYLEDMSFVPSDDIDLSDQIITDADIEEAKEKLISLLSPEDREMYECYYMQKMTYAEVAKKIGIDRNTASKRLHVIKKRLEDEARKMFAVGGAVTLLRIIAALLERWE